MRYYKPKLKKIALERIIELFKQADLAFAKNPALANRYVHIAKRISTKNKVKIPLELKRKFCKRCLSYWKPGKTVRIRLLKGKKVYYCLICKQFTRVPYK